MRAPRADEVVAAVLGRSHHEVVAGEQREGAGERVGRKMGRVAVEGDHAPAAVADEEPEDRVEPRGEPVALLLDHLDVQPARDVSSIATRADDRDARHARLARERHRVLDQAAIESDERVWGNGRFETGLHAAGARRLRHDDERAVVEGIGHQGGTAGARKRCFTIPPRIPHAAPSVPRTVPLIFERPSRGW